MHQLDFNKLKHLHFKGHHQENEKKKTPLHNGRKYQQIMYLIRDTDRI